MLPLIYIKPGLLKLLSLDLPDFDVVAVADNYDWATCVELLNDLVTVDDDDERLLDGLSSGEEG